MPKTKKKGADAASGAKPLDALELKIKELSEKNEMLDRTLKEREKRLNKMEALNAQERILTGEAPEAGEETDPDDGGPSPFFPRNLGTGGGGVFRSRPSSPEQADEYIRKQEEFEIQLRDFTQTEGKVDVYKLGSDGNTWEKMGSNSAKDWGTSLEKCAKTFGGGTYKVRLRAPNGTFVGENIVDFNVDAYPKPSAVAAAPLQRDNSAEMTKMMMEMQLRMHQESQAQQAQFMQTMATMMGQKASMINSVQDLALFKEMFAEKKTDKKSPTEDLNVLLTVLDQGMKLGAQTAPPEAEGGGGLLSKLLMNLLTGENVARVGDIMKNAVQSPPARNPQPQLPAPGQAPVRKPAQPQPQAASHANPPQEKKEMKNPFILAYKAVILGYARKNQSPKKTAELIVSRIGGINPNWLLIVDDFLKLPDTKEKFVFDYAPELREHEAWVDKVMKEMGIYIKECLEASADQADVVPEPVKAQEPEKPATPENPEIVKK